MGLTILKDTIAQGTYQVPTLIQRTENNPDFRHRLQRFIGNIVEGEEINRQAEKKLQKLKKELTIFLQMKAYEDFSYSQVLSFLTNTLKKVGMPQVSKENPVKSRNGRFLLHLGSDIFNASPNPDSLLPYLIKDIPLLPSVHNQKIKINANTTERGEWISTGLYLSPGMRTSISFPSSMVNTGWMVQIGCQTDYLRHQELQRAPTVLARFLVTSEKMQVWNLWGGLIYFMAPSKTKVEGEVIVEKAVAAPFYKFGVTTEAGWRSQRVAPAPWAEFEFENLIITVPSTVIRNLEGVDKVAVLWNGVMKGVAELAATPPKFVRKERFVTDVQISVGWMHSGYPIMMHTTMAHELFDHERAKIKGQWGPVHELGHNQQKSSWDFPRHTTEATCNLWSVYVHEKVLGLARDKAHGMLSSGQRNNAIDEFVHGGQSLDGWSVWTALETYLQLQERFGWDAFKKVHADYQTMDNVPNDNAGKMNLYAEVFSRTVDMDLTEFFQAWGWPIEEETEDKLSNLPSWDDHPMAQYI